MNNVVNQTPYLRTTREFPEDIHQLNVEINKSYVDIANCVNNRTISLFPTSRPAITGENFFLSKNQRQQTLRQVYPFGAIATGTSISINHNIQNIVQFSAIYGTCITSLPDYRPIPYASVAANGNIDLRVTSTQIIINNGAGAQNITSGIIILEWISQP